jgi:hypothetical protein
MREIIRPYAKSVEITAPSYFSVAMLRKLPF